MPVANLATYSGSQAQDRAVVKIRIGGEDVTARARPYLISVECTDKFTGDDTTTCSIELDDSNGQLAIPKPGSPIQIDMGWVSSGTAQVYDGLVAEVESGCARKGGGRRLWIDGYSADMMGAGKTRFQMHMGEGDKEGQPGPPIPLAGFFAKAAANAGYAGIVSPSMAAITRSYWAQNEPFHHLGVRLAREFGGVFQVVGGKTAVLVSQIDGMMASGIMAGSVTAIWGSNLIAWRVKPFLARPQAAMAKAESFKFPEGVWKVAQKAIGGSVPFGLATAEAWRQNASATEDQADQSNEGMAAESESARSAGWVLIEGNPQAHGGGTCTIQGARPGVDGSWRISEAEHSYSRASGYVTRCTLEQFGAPSGGVPAPPGTSGYENW